MNFGFFNKSNNLKIQREEFAKTNAVNDLTEIVPCKKFVAVQEKLSKNYCLALSDTTTIEAQQVADPNNVEFYEGYEMATQYTDSVRKNAVDIALKIYENFEQIISCLGNYSEGYNFDNIIALSDIKIEMDVNKDIILNIFQHLTMTSNVPRVKDNEPKAKIRSKDLKRLILSTVGLIINLKSKLIIDYIVRQLDIMLDKFMMLNILTESFD